MNRTQDYVADSLELHLFFARIMKEHAFFLKAGFMPPDAALAKEAGSFIRKFENLLTRTVNLSNHAVSQTVLDSGEIVTEFTDGAEQLTQKYTGTPFNRGLTARTARLTCGRNNRPSQALVHQVRMLNRDGLTLIEGLINFKERLLRRINSCRSFTVNYPLLIEHILREARLYQSHLMHLEGMSCSTAQEIRDNELFWNRIMMEHAMFIRGLLDPGEEELVDAADDFAEEYEELLEACTAANNKVNESLKLTERFRDFKQAGVEGINGCRIRSIILPLLADHVLREANHYIRLLED